MGTEVDDTIPYDKVLADFQSFVAICKRLKELEKLHSGFVFGIQEDGRIGVKPIPPTFDPEEGPPDLAEVARKMLASYQSVREALAKSFDLTSEEWNVSSIGRMMNYIEKEMREQVYSVESDVEGKSGRGTHNPYTICYLSQSAHDLFTMVLTRGFVRKWRYFKLRALNQAAEKFFERTNTRNLYQSMSSSAQLLLAIDELLSKRGDEPAMQKMVRQMVASGIGKAIEQFFSKDLAKSH